MKLDLNTEQLEFLQFIIDNFEYNDDEERALKDSIESQLFALVLFVVWTCLNLLSCTDFPFL